MQQTTQQTIIFETIQSLGGTATIKEITTHAINKTKFLSICHSKTPEANIRRILQLNKLIYKVKSGLYTIISPT